MQSDNKRIAKNTLFMYFRMFFTMCVSLYTSRVVLSALGFSDYGLYNVVGGIIAMFAFINGAMTNMTSRFITYYLGNDDRKRLNEVFSMSFFIHCCLAIIILILGETIGLWFFYNKMIIPEGRMVAAMWVYQLSIAQTMMAIVVVPFNSDIIAHEKMSIYAYISIVNSILNLIIVSLLSISPIDRLIFYALLLFSVQVLVFLFNLFYCRRHYIESKIRRAWDKTMLKEMGKFTGWSMFGNFSYVFYTQGLNILINMFCGPVVNAARGIAVHVESAMTQFTTSIQTAINPQIIKSYSKNDIMRMQTLIFASSKYCFFLMLLLSMPVMLGADYILRIWLGEFPDHTINFLRLTLLCVLIDTLVNPLYTGNLATGKVAIYNKRLAILSLSFIPITYLGIRFTHIPEILFLLNVIRNIIGLGVRMFIMRKQLNIGIRVYFAKVLNNVIIVSILSSVLPIVAYKTVGCEDFLSFFATITISALSVLVCVYLLGLNSTERQLITIKAVNIVKSRIGYCK